MSGPADGATPGQAAPAMPDSAVLRAAILATEVPASGTPLEWTDRERLDGIIASWIGRELPPGTPSSVTASAAQRVTAGLAPFVEAEALRLAQAAVAAPQPQPQPSGKRDPLSCPCCVFGDDDCWCRADCGVERCQARDLDAATPGQAAYEVGDRVRVTGAVTGTNRKYDWVNIDAGGSKFTFSGASASPDISHAAAREPHAADGQRPLEQLAIAAFGAWINATSAEHALLSWSQRPESDRAAFRAAADAVQMMLDMPSAQPQPAPGLAAAKPDLGTAWRLLNETREQLALLQDSIGNLAAGLKLSADASRPSKKSQIEDGCAAALLAILDPR